MGTMGCGHILKLNSTGLDKMRCGAYNKIKELNLVQDGKNGAWDI
jgi:hypothetical protein